MGMDTWLIIAGEGPIGGMVAAARRLGGKVTVAAVGPRALADAAAASGPDSVRWFPVPPGVPSEALADSVVSLIAGASPRVVLGLDDPASRVIWGKAAAALQAAAISAVIDLGREGDVVVITRSVADGRAIETLEAQGVLAGIFEGEDAESQGPIPEVTPVPDPGAAVNLRLIDAAGGSEAQVPGLLRASRVIGVGFGVSSREGVKQIEELAAELGAELGCSLPVADQLHWLDPSLVIGVSHNRITPDLYLALGVSGQPQHMSGVRDAKVVVAVNRDPQASIFSKCDYGIVGDLGEIVPALTAALKTWVRS